MAAFEEKGGKGFSSPVLIITFNFESSEGPSALPLIRANAKVQRSGEVEVQYTQKVNKEVSPSSRRAGGPGSRFIAVHEVGRLHA